MLDFNVAISSDFLTLFPVIFQEVPRHITSPVDLRNLEKLSFVRLDVRKGISGTQLVDEFVY